MSAMTEATLYAVTPGPQPADPTPTEPLRIESVQTATLAQPTEVMANVVTVTLSRSLDWWEKEVAGMQDIHTHTDEPRVTLRLDLTEDDALSNLRMRLATVVSQARARRQVVETRAAAQKDRADALNQRLRQSKPVTETE